jgi:hypothetical protein
MLLTQPGTVKQRFPPWIGEKEIGQPNLLPSVNDVAEVGKGSKPFPTPNFCMAELAAARGLTRHQPWFPYRSDYEF